MNRDPSAIEAEVRTLLGALYRQQRPSGLPGAARAQSVPRRVLGTVSPDPGRIPVVGRCRGCGGHHQAGGLVEVAPLVAVPA